MCMYNIKVIFVWKANRSVQLIEKYHPFPLYS